MRKILLSTLAVAALAFDALPDSNIAYRRAVYQSSAADFTHVGHLVTDGVKSAEPLQLTETRVELPGKSPDNERAKCATDGRALVPLMPIMPASSAMPVQYPAMP